MLGFLRETQDLAIKAGIDKETGLCRTGLEIYLNILFPDVKWIHDKPLGKVDNKVYRIRPDYRNDELRIIVEFDGIQHYQSPVQILKDIENTKIYKSLGYKVIRIPYFIQLTKSAVKNLFNIEPVQELFPEDTPSLGNNPGDPAYLCPVGIKRMAEEFHMFPDQYEVNIKHLKEINNDFLTGASLLEKYYEQT